MSRINSNILNIKHLLMPTSVRKMVHNCQKINKSSAISWMSS